MLGAVDERDECARWKREGYARFNCVRLWTRSGLLFVYGMDLGRRAVHSQER